MFDGKFRQSVDATTAPIGRWLVRVGFSADVLTASGLVFAGATAWAIAVGLHYWAVVLLTLTGFHDLFDGPVAKASHRASQRGSFFDSVADRLADAGTHVVGVHYWRERDLCVEGHVERLRRRWNLTGVRHVEEDQGSAHPVL